MINSDVYDVNNVYTTWSIQYVAAHSRERTVDAHSGCALLLVEQWREINYK